MADNTPTPSTPSRHSFTSKDIIHDIWASLSLPAGATSNVDLPGDSNDKPSLPSSFKIGPIAQSSIALTALTARLILSTRKQLGSGSGSSIWPQLRVPVDHAAVEFKSNNLYTIQRNNVATPPFYNNPVGGLHKAADGYVRIHDLFPDHVKGTLQLLGLPADAGKADVAAKVKEWKKVDLETEATERAKVAIYAVRSYDEWDAHPQAQAMAAAYGRSPIILSNINEGAPPKPLPAISTTPNSSSHADQRQGIRCLSGLRVVELSRVIAGPVSGKTLAAHGADVLWVTSPNLPAIPPLDIDLSRGKRNIHVDIHKPEDKARLIELIKTCDVFIQGYRPGSLASYGLSPDELVKLNPNIVCANMSAFGPHGPWAHRRGFDSLVQSASGMNVSEAEHEGKGDPAKAMPCQALDHASGYFLATGIMAALYHRATSGGAWVVDVSLASTMMYLRSLGQYPGSTGFDAVDYKKADDVPSEAFETRQTGFGELTAVKHSAEIDGCGVGWDAMPCPPEENKASWIGP